jgi:hypothetical protein
MNKRIKLLMGQVLDEKFAGTWSVIDMQDLTKFADRFAELIVRECISELEISKKVDPYTGVLFDCEYNKCIDEQSTMLKEHFGVEE